MPELNHSEPSAIFELITDYLAMRGFDTTETDEREIMAFLKGHKSAEEAEAYESRARNIRIYVLDPRDVKPDDRDVMDLSFTKRSQPLGTYASPAIAVQTAKALATERGLPLIVMDDNAEGYTIVDEPLREDAEYAVLTTVGELYDPTATHNHSKVADGTVMDSSGMLNLRAAYSFFASALRWYRQEPNEKGNMLMIVNYGSKERPSPIVHREII